MHNRFTPKKNYFQGFTLVEVVIALSILTIALMGSLTLVVTLLNLAMINRDSTEAMGLLQKGMANAQVRINSSCGTNVAGTTTDTVSGKSREIKILILDDPTDPSVPDEFFDHFYLKVVGTVSWNLRGQSYHVDITQYLRGDCQ